VTPQDQDDAPRSSALPDCGGGGDDGGRCQTVVEEEMACGGPRTLRRRAFGSSAAAPRGAPPPRPVGHTRPWRSRCRRGREVRWGGVGREGRCDKGGKGREGADCWIAHNNSPSPPASPRLACRLHRRGPRLGRRVSSSGALRAVASRVVPRRRAASNGGGSAFEAACSRRLARLARVDGMVGPWMMCGGLGVDV
jgi:hypothetical protein